STRAGPSPHSRHRDIQRAARRRLLLPPEHQCIELARDPRCSDTMNSRHESHEHPEIEAMETQTQTQAQKTTKPEPDAATENKIQQVRALLADAPDLGKKALENALGELKSQASELPPAIESAGRTGARLGKVSELTIIVPLAPGGADRLRAFLKVL